jgi:hypothetical protein
LEGVIKVNIWHKPPLKRNKPLLFLLVFMMNLLEHFRVYGGGADE